MWHPCRNDAIEPWNLDVQYLAVEEEEGGERLVLRGGGNSTGHGKMRQELLHLPLAELEVRGLRGLRGRRHVSILAGVIAPVKRYGPGISAVCLAESKCKVRGWRAAPLLLPKPRRKISCVVYIARSN